MLKKSHSLPISHAEIPFFLSWFFLISDHQGFKNAQWLASPSFTACACASSKRCSSSCSSAARAAAALLSRGDDWGSPIGKAHRFNMLPKKTILWLCPDDFEAVRSFLSVYLQKYPHHLHVWGFTPQWLPVFNLSIILGCQLPGTTNKKGSWTFHERGCSWLQYVVLERLTTIQQWSLISGS